MTATMPRQPAQTATQPPSTPDAQPSTPTALQAARSPYYTDDTVTLYHGDALAVLPTLPEASVDAVVTDPPYEIKFMDTRWDASGIAYNTTLWRETLRVLKPGGHLLAFGGTRTVHRLTCAIEDAGYEIRDGIDWIYASGMPKGMALGGGQATALKPAREPIVVARKPLARTIAANVLEHGTGALQIDACRVGPSVDTRRPTGRSALSFDESSWRSSAAPTGTATGGRWPTNVALSHAPSCAVDACPPGCPVALLGAQQAGASSYYPVFRYQAKASSRERPRVNGITHPTVKPLALMRWLVRLVTPPGGVALDPFAGSGTTAEAALLEGYRCIAIEREPDYLPLISARLARAVQPVLPTT